jgi:hypothetical protein
VGGWNWNLSKPFNLAMAYSFAIFQSKPNYNGPSVILVTTRKFCLTLLKEKYCPGLKIFFLANLIFFSEQVIFTFKGEVPTPSGF